MTMAMISKNASSKKIKLKSIFSGVISKSMSMAKELKLMSKLPTSNRLKERLVNNQKLEWLTLS